MKTNQHIWKQISAGWRETLVIATPIFVLAMWFGIHQRFPDLGLFAVIMALGALHIAGLAVGLFHKLREHRRKSEEALMPNRPAAIGASRSANASLP